MIKTIQNHYTLIQEIARTSYQLAILHHTSHQFNLNINNNIINNENTYNTIK